MKFWKYYILILVLSAGFLSGCSKVTEGPLMLANVYNDYTYNINSAIYKGMFE